MLKTLKDLVLALLNATLILIALCLFLGWKVSSTIDTMLMDFVRQVEIVGPMRSDVQDMTDEIRGLRSDLAGLAAGVSDPQLLDRVQTRLSQVDGRVAAMGDRLDALLGLPEQMLDQSIEKLGLQAAHTINNIRGCTPSGDDPA